MTSNLFDIITRKSKNISLEASRRYNSQGYSVVPYEQLIVTHKDYPNNHFLVHKNMIFIKGLEDTSYDVYKFDNEGSLLDKNDYPKTFFRDMQIVKRID